MEVYELIKQPRLMDKETLYDLRGLLALHPYYQTARLLLLQNLYLLHDPTFDEELRRASIYITDRKKLFNLVEAAHYQLKTKSQEPSAKKENAEADKPEKGSRMIALIDNFLDSIPQDEEGENATMRRKPTPADATVDYVAYLLETENELPDAEVETTAPEMKGQSLIDNFIDNEGGKIHLNENPEFTPETENEAKDDENDADEGYFTETLAKIYIKQGRYSKALEIIQRLNLNYPKKNAYFADQIRFLEKLILNSKTN
ncbi:MAG: tetratricopeptide repeat protein [Prevotella sp.]|nr:tetratricopeptide repeat protein [Prevotella sp.]